MSSRRILAFAALAAAAILSAGGTFAAATAGTTDLRLVKLNRTYTDFVPPLDTVYEGGVSVQLASPKQALLLRDNRIHLKPQPDGTFAGDVELDIQGKGQFIADVTFGALNERFDEVVIVPPQTLRIEGRAKIRRVDGGYAIEPIEMPRKLSVAIQSPTINAILTLCDQAAIVSLGTIDCSGLERALTRPAVTIPEGGSFTLQDSDLTEADRNALDKLLAPSAAAPPG